MNKKVVYGVFVVLILLGVFVTLKFGPELTTGSIGYKYRCVSPQEANNLVERQGCWTIEDSECAEKSLAAVKCP